MATAHQYEAWIQEITDPQTLAELACGRELAGRVWEPGKAYEYAVIQGFRLALAAQAGVEIGTHAETDAQTRWPYSVQDPSPDSAYGQRAIEQVDGALHIGHLHVLVETKDFGDPSGIAPIVKLKSQLNHRPPGTLGIVFGPSDGFTFPAQLLAAWGVPASVLLWDKAEFVTQLTQGDMIAEFWRKLRVLAEERQPWSKLGQGADLPLEEEFA